MSPMKYCACPKAVWSLGLICVALLASPFAGAVQLPQSIYGLQIISPQPGLTTANRYYRAYPGLDYNVQIGVVGGAYPYTYSLASGDPTGMTIDANSGILDWPNPVAGSQPYTVGVTVTDSDGNTARVQWPITVTTNGFLFVDAKNGKTVAQGGDGTISNPFQTISDWYVSKYNTQYQGYFVYFKNGTYNTNAAPVEAGNHLAVIPNQPMVWLAYPGNNPVIDTTGSYVEFYGGTSNAYVEGITFQNFTAGFGVRIDSDASNVVFRLNQFLNLPSGAGGSGTNAAGLMIARGSSPGTNWLVVSNNFQGVYDEAYGLLGYYSSNVLVNRNHCSDFVGPDAMCLAPKEGTERWFIRNNRINVLNGYGILMDLSDTGTYESQDVELSYNLVQVTTGDALSLGNAAVPFGVVRSFRNTYIGGVGDAAIQGGVELVDVTSTDGPVSFTNDVIVNASNPIVDQHASNFAVLTNDLTGAPTTGIVDASGNLTGSFVKYLGTDGYQLGSALEPSPPGDVAVH